MFSCVRFIERHCKIFTSFFLVGILIQELIRLPHQWRSGQTRKQQKISHDGLTPSNAWLDRLAFGGLEIVPIFYVFTPWLRFANYPLPTWVSWIGGLLLALGLGILWRAHQDLGRQWSSTLAIQTDHMLVMQGLYRLIRHPIYAALWLLAIAQAALLPNWVAGYAGLLGFLPLYWVRVPQEEQSLLRHFGDAYRGYMGRTGRLIPRFGRGLVGQ